MNYVIVNKCKDTKTCMEQETEPRALVNISLCVIKIKSTPEQIFKSAIHPFHIIFYFHSSQATVKPEVPFTFQNSLYFRTIT